MTMIGIIWAAFAPLLLVAAIAALGFALRRRGVARALLIAAALVVAPVATVYWLERAEFRQICEDAGRAVIHAKARAEGILLTSGTANSFGMRYLHEEGFAWVEMRDVYRRGGWARVTRETDGKITTAPIDTPTARYEVRETFEQPRPSVGLTVTQVIDRESGAELARAANGHFDGGRVKWVLGAYGVSSCPSAFSDSDGFRRFYHLARETLR